MNADDEWLHTLAVRLAPMIQALQPPTVAPAAAQAWMNTRQAALYTGYAKCTLDNLRHKGGGPKYFQPSANCVRYKREDLDAFLAREGARRNTSEVAARGAKRGRPRKRA